MGEKNQLPYIRDKEKREVDFLVLRDRKIDSIIEVKLSDDEITLRFHPETSETIQLHKVEEQAGYS
jgi:glutamine amidotransferase PdxT